jgi:hypothetical protein
MSRPSASFFKSKHQDFYPLISSNVNWLIHFSLLWIFHQSTLTHALKSVEVVAQVCLKI